MFTKLFSSIIYSSVWQEDDATRLVWITMLALADRRGFVYGSVPGLASAARVKVVECRAALEKFEAPDPESTNPENEGRRVEKVSGGWRLLNYEIYRGIRDEESRREYKTNWQREARQGKRGAAAREEREAKKKAILKAPGSLAERLALQAEKDGDGEMLARLSEIDRAKQAQNEAFQRKMAETIAAVQLEAAEKESLSGDEGEAGVPLEGVDGEKFPEV